MLKREWSYFENSGVIDYQIEGVITSVNSRSDAHLGAKETNPCLSVGCIVTSISVLL